MSRDKEERIAKFLEEILSEVLTDHSHFETEAIDNEDIVHLRDCTEHFMLRVWCGHADHSHYTVWPCTKELKKIYESARMLHPNFELAIDEAGAMLGGKVVFIALNHNKTTFGTIAPSDATRNGLENTMAAVIKHFEKNQGIKKEECH